MTIEIIPILNDNYCYAVHNGDQSVIIVDPGEAAPVMEWLANRNLKASAILNTHHHHDHIAGNRSIKDRYQCPVVGPEADRHRIADLDQGVEEGDTLTLGTAAFDVIATPGHTSGHISFYMVQEEALFCGDTLFSMGCGRLFEDSPQQMWNSLQKIAALPDDTMIYCGHEYTESNGAFCLTIEPKNKALQTRMNEVKKLRADNKPTLPVSLKTEKETNVFLRAGSAECFAELRTLKDNA